MSSGQSTGASEATDSAPQLSAGSAFSVMPDPGLRLVRRWARWSTAQRRVLAIALSAWALAAAFPAVQDLSRWWLFVPAMFVWGTSIGRLFVPWERITGMWRVRREVRLRRATENPGGWIVALDGREILSGSAEVFCWKSWIIFEGRGAGGDTPIWTVALRLDDDVYEIERTSGVESAQTLARVLAHEIHGDASKVRQPHIGPDVWQPEFMGGAVSGFVPLVAKAIGLASLAANDLRFVLIGALAIAVRVALVGERLANATARQLDRRFAKDFGGARPARPVLWLKPEPVRRALFWSRWLMYGAAASVLLHC